MQCGDTGRSPFIERGKTVLVTMTACLALGGASFAQRAQSSQDSPQELVKKTVANEINASSATKFMFCDRKSTPKGSDTRLIIETKSATVGMLIAKDDKPLSAADREAEDNRLERFFSSASERQKKERKEKDDSDRTKEVMRALPDAFIFERAGLQSGGDGTGRNGHPLTRLNFHPNPKFVPPTRVQQVLVGLEGYVLIDEGQHRIAEIDGNFVKDVDFGWGILGRLTRGGHFRVRQADEGDGTWELTQLDLDIHGKVLMFKSIDVVSNEVFSDFRRAPDDLTLEQGVHMLLNQKNELAKNIGGSGSSARLNRH